MKLKEDPPLPQQLELSFPKQDEAIRQIYEPPDLAAGVEASIAELLAVMKSAKETAELVMKSAIPKHVQAPALKKLSQFVQALYSAVPTQWQPLAERMVQEALFAAEEKEDSPDAPTTQTAQSADTDTGPGPAGDSDGSASAGGDDLATPLA